jgi:hypothetical protein
MKTCNTLDNFGYVMGDIPDDLFNKLKDECELTDKARYLENNDRDPMYSGITSKGVAKHFYVKENAEELKHFVYDMFYFYEKNFNYLATCRMLSHPTNCIPTKPWINIQERGEYIPNHTHDGIMTYAIWIKIPYDINNEIDHSNKNNNQSTSCFEFTYPSIIGSQINKKIHLNKEWEGKILMFPSALQHCVYPFYTSDENRISISGMITFDTSGNKPV